MVTKNDKDGKIELSELPSDVKQSRVIVEKASQMITFGMFAGSNKSRGM